MINNYNQVNYEVRIKCSKLPLAQYPALIKKSPNEIFHPLQLRRIPPPPDAIWKTLSYIFNKNLIAL